MTILSGSIQIQSNISTPSPIPGGLPLTSNQPVGWNIVPGTGAINKADNRYSKVFSFTAAAQTIDLTALNDPFGVAITVSRVKEILITNLSTVDANVLTLGYATTTANAWTAFLSCPGTITIQPSTANNQGCFLILAPNLTAWPVDATHKLLKLDPGSATFQANVEILVAST